MRVSARSPLVTAGLALMLAVSGCSEDTTDPDKNGGNNGGNNGGDNGGGNGGGNNGGDNGGGNGGDNNGGGGGLEDGVAGLACTEDGGECGKGTCADKLTGGTIGSFASDFLPGLANSVEGGYCTATCSKDADCGEGAICYGTIPEEALGPFAGFGGLLGGLIQGECRKTCEDNAGCGRAGFECAKFNSAALDGVQGVPDNIRGTLTLPNSCIPEPKPNQLQDGVVGKACMNNDECGDGFCLGASAGMFGQPARAGVCSGTCVVGQDSTCGSDGVCVPGFYGSAGTCSEKCTAGDDSTCSRAAEGFVCQNLLGKDVCVYDPPDPVTPDAGPGADSGTGDDDPDAGTGDGGA